MHMLSKILDYLGWARSKGLLILQNVSVNNDEFSAKICFNIYYFDFNYDWFMFCFK